MILISGIQSYMYQSSICMYVWHPFSLERQWISCRTDTAHFSWFMTILHMVLQNFVTSFITLSFQSTTCHMYPGLTKMECLLCLRHQLKLEHTHSQKCCHVSNKSLVMLSLLLVTTGRSRAWANASSEPSTATSTSANLLVGG